MGGGRAMNFNDYIDLFGNNIIYLFEQHLMLFALALLGAAVLGISLGVLTHRFQPFARLAVPLINVLQACPEIVLLALSIPLFGIGVRGALIPLFLKGVLPILRNTSSGLRSVDPRLLEAAQAMGMTQRQILFRVEIPAVLPVVISGIRISAVMLVSVLTLTAYIGVDSLGTLIVQGISRMDMTPLLIGCGLTAMLALSINYLLLSFERILSRRMSGGVSWR
jgi:osmoprotectant transport system permease protein